MKTLLVLAVIALIGSCYLVWTGLAISNWTLLLSIPVTAYAVLAVWKLWSWIEEHP